MPDETLDPRPVFAGDWAKATGKERQAHMVVVNAWKARQEESTGDAQSPMAAGSARDAGGAQGGNAAPQPSGDAQTRAVLISIRDDADAHDSDRIRAAQALIGMEREAEGRADAPSPLVALKQVLDTLAPEERLAWLQGERLEAMPTGGAA